MRTEHDAGTEDLALVRARMIRLASSFPGALREIDELELDEIRDRIAQLDAVLHGRLPVQRWMEALALFHALARGALCAKRWLSRRRQIDEALRAAYAAALTTFPYPDDARLWVGELERVASPPEGRIVELVVARAARELATTQADVRALVFGGAVRRGRRRRRRT